MTILKDLSPDLARAVWEMDFDALPSCICCCDEHTFTTGCPAYIWGGCRGQNATTHDDVESWAKHYERFHGMRRDKFFGYDAEDAA